MERRDFIKTSILGTGILVGSSVLNADTKTSKSQKVSMRFEYQIGFPSAKDIKLWLPMPLATDFQKPSKLKITGNYKTHKTYVQENTPIVYAQYSQSSTPKKISVDLDVFLTTRSAQITSEPSVQKFLTSSRFIRIDGKIGEIAANLHARNDEEKVHQIYHWVINNLNLADGQDITGIRTIYDKNSVPILSGKDISANTIFVSLCRACKIPAREAMGISLRKSKTEFVSKSEVYLESLGWVPYDPIATLKNPSIDGKKRWEGEFVLLNYDRDIKINKHVLGIFNTAFGLIDNDRLNYYENKNFVQDISFKLIS